MGTESRRDAGSIWKSSAVESSSPGKHPETPSMDDEDDDNRSINDE